MVGASCKVENPINERKSGSNKGISRGRRVPKKLQGLPGMQHGTRFTPPATPVEDEDRSLRTADHAAERDPQSLRTYETTSTGHASSQEQWAHLFAPLPAVPRPREMYAQPSGQLVWPGPDTVVTDTSPHQSHSFPYEYTGAYTNATQHTYHWAPEASAVSYPFQDNPSIWQYQHNSAASNIDSSSSYLMGTYLLPAQGTCIQVPQQATHGLAPWSSIGGHAFLAAAPQYTYDPHFDQGALEYRGGDSEGHFEPDQQADSSAWFDGRMY